MKRRSIFSNELNNDYFGNYVNRGIFTFRNKLEQIFSQVESVRRKTWMLVFPIWQIDDFYWLEKSFFAKI